MRMDRQKNDGPAHELHPPCDDRKAQAAAITSTAPRLIRPVKRLCQARQRFFRHTRPVIGDFQADRVILPPCADTDMYIDRKSVV